MEQTNTLNIENDTKKKGLKGIVFKPISSFDERRKVIDLINEAIKRCNYDGTMGIINNTNDNLKITFWCNKNEKTHGVNINLPSVKYGWNFYKEEWKPAKYMEVFNYDKLVFNEIENEILNSLYRDRFS